MQRGIFVSDAADNLGTCRCSAGDFLKYLRISVFLSFSLSLSLFLSLTLSLKGENDIFSTRLDRRLWWGPSGHVWADIDQNS